MAEEDREQSESGSSAEANETEAGYLYLEEKPEDAPPDTPVASVPSSEVQPQIQQSPQDMERAGTIEHLAARRLVPELDTDTPEMKHRMSELRAEVTRIVTGLRWEDLPIEEAAERMISLLNVGSVQQWKGTLIPFLYEIDRGGALIPVWLEIIQQGDPRDLPPETNPAETMEGRGRRFAILMLGNYRTMGISGIKKSSRISSQTLSKDKTSDLTQVLGRLSTDPNTSMYATQSLVKHASVPATQALVSTLKDARGWAKVDIIEGILALKQDRFYDLLVASGLDDVSGLESYTAIPLYREIPLEHYLQTSSNPRLTQQAALIFNQVLQDSMTPPTDEKKLPVVFEQHLPTLAKALFEGARSNPMWQNTVAIHRLGIFMGRYWTEISRGSIKDGRIIEPVYQTLPMMNDVERWMAGPGRDVLLSTLTSGEEKLTPTIKVLGEVREPRAITPLITLIDETTTLRDRSHALTIGAICDTLGSLGDRRAASPMQRLLMRTVETARRTGQLRRRDNLAPGDANIPGSIVYAAVVRALGLLGDKNELNTVLSATNDFDPYVRTQAIEAIKRLDPTGEDPRSRMVVREALNDPRESVVRAASQLVVQYRDIDASTTLRQVIETRPELAGVAYDTLRQIGQ